MLARIQETTTTPSRGGLNSHPLGLKGEGVHTIAIVTSPMSVHTLRIQRKKSLSSSNYAKIKFEKVEDRETMEVLSPYLAAFWTIAGLHKHMCQYTVEREQSQVDIIERLRCEMKKKIFAIHVISPATCPPQIWDIST